MKNTISYQDAGVDIEKANSFIERIKPIVKATARSEVRGSIGGFGGLFNFESAKFKKPVLVASTDGVGTKLLIARRCNRHDTIGIDLVAMSVNDLVVQGAEPLFFLDYFAAGKLDPDRDVKIIAGIAQGCKEAGCSLLGGETAEMPGVYGDDEYDLAGFAVGVVDEDKLIDGSEIREGDDLIGLASSGLHSNGYSLARKILLDIAGLDLNAPLEKTRGSLGQELLIPTKIYVKAVLHIIKNFSIGGIVHITGGGFIDNIPRIIPAGCQAKIFTNKWEPHPIFRIIQAMGNVTDREMFRTFNMGIGLILIVSPSQTDDVLHHLQLMGEAAFAIGRVHRKTETDEAVLLS